MNCCSFLRLLLPLGVALACAEPRLPPADGAIRRTVSASAPSNAASGVMRLLTYNVAGLPAPFSPSDPAAHIPKVSPLLNDYELVVAQEDFAYHQELIQSAGHPYQLAPLAPRATLIGDGLATLSAYPLFDVEREQWNTCSGYLLRYSDCLAEKGFSRVRVRLGESASLDLYNVHADAGESEEDVEARRQGFEQLAGFIQERSSGRALVVAGDFNLDLESQKDRTVLSTLLKATGLKDACSFTRCAERVVDRVLFRASPGLDLSVRSWRADARFVNAEGEPLSDHLPISVELHWRLGGSLARSDRAP